MSDQWKVGKKKTKGLKKQTEKAVLIGLVTGRQSEEQVKEYLDELEFLAATAGCLLYTSPSPRDRQKSRMPSSA